MSASMTFLEAERADIASVCSDQYRWVRGDLLELIVKEERTRCSRLAAQLGVDPAVVHEIDQLGGCSDAAMVNHPSEWSSRQ